MIKPRCPHCNAQGLNHLAVYRAGVFAVVYCNQCGAIYGVVPTQAQPQNDHSGEKENRPPESKPTSRIPKPTHHIPKTEKYVSGPDTPFQHIAFTDRDLVRIVSDYVGQKVSLSPDQIQHMYRNTSPDDRFISPKCPEHYLPMVKLTIPQWLKYEGEMLWACPKYSECHNWIPATISDQNIDPRIADIGDVDLSNKTPYSPEKMANRAKAAGLGRGTAYLQFSIDDGPPLCLQHKTEMEKITIPPGYKNAGKVFWVCPQYDDCHQWELAEE